MLLDSPSISLQPLAIGNVRQVLLSRRSSHVELVVDFGITKSIIRRT